MNAERELLHEVFAGALADLDLATRVAESLPAPALRAREPTRVLAIGKGAPAMATGALRRLAESQRAIEACLVVTPPGTDTRELVRAAKSLGLGARLEVLHGAHPLPDASSLRAGEACLDFVRTTERRRVVVLVSGGASSLVCAPSSGVTLRTKRAVTKALLASGASIQELNVVRKHLSRVKGGGLWRAALPNDVLTRIASDVIAGAPSDVGSGPTVPDGASTIAMARRILRRFLPGPLATSLPLARLPRVSPASIWSARQAKDAIVASPEELALAAARRLREHGVKVLVLPASVAPVEELAIEYVQIARKWLRALDAQPRAVVRAAEPSVVIPRGARAGRGGRSTHLAALVGRALAALALPSSTGGIVFGALASDGVDGTSGTSGAIVDASFAHGVLADCDRALRSFDTGPLHVERGTALREHPSGHNLADVHVMMKGVSADVIARAGV